MEMEKPKRPTGVTILAVLEILSAIALIFLGFVMLILGDVAIAMLGLTTPIPGLVPAALMVVACIMFVLALLYLFIVWGLWEGKGWAWTVALVFVILGMLSSVISMLSGSYQNVIALLIQVLIVYYLYRPQVKAYFGKK